MSLIKYLLIALLTITAGVAVAAEPAKEASFDRVIIVINKDVITSSDLDHAIAAAPKDKPANRDEVLNSLIDTILLRQEIDQSKINVSDADLSRAIQNILEQNHITLSQLKLELRKQNVNYADYRETMRIEIRRIKFVNQIIGSKVAISEQEMADYFQEHLAEFGQTKSVEIAEIFLPFSPDMTEEAANALEKKASQLAKTAKKGDFEALAKKHSQDPFAASGGNMGVVDLSTLRPEVADVVMHMKEGAVSDPILSPAGFQIIKVIHRKQATLDDFDQVKDQINTILYEKKMKEAVEEYVKELRKNAFIDIKTKQSS